MQAAMKNLDVDLEKTDFFITHSHVDHIGLVFRLIHAGSVVYINEVEAEIISKIKTGVLHSEIGVFFQISGFPEEDFEKIFPPDAIHQYRSGDVLPFRFVKDKEIIERGEYRFTCVKTPGHSKGHMCLYEPDKKILVAGDHILEDITPGIQEESITRNPLKEYLFSLDKVYRLGYRHGITGPQGPFQER